MGTFHTPVGPIVVDADVTSSNMELQMPIGGAAPKDMGTISTL